MLTNEQIVEEVLKPIRWRVMLWTGIPMYLPAFIGGLINFFRVDTIPEKVVVVLIAVIVGILVGTASYYISKTHFNEAVSKLTLYAVLAKPDNWYPFPTSESEKIHIDKL